MTVSTINLTNKPFVCSDMADASTKAKRYAKQAGKAYWFWQSGAGFAYCSEVPDGIPVPSVRAEHLHEGITRVIVPPNAP